ncbi:MAG: hotdog fold thioesterase [Bifidobacteriaceae bacterium]|nr:hotdog fold thioesterase [Bifidobacteriaceae bacterium]
MVTELGALENNLGIEILSAEIDEVVGRMPVRGNTQTFGRLHGGATLALGETLGSIAADLHAAATGRLAVGVDINGTLHAAARTGYVIGTAVPVHLGRRITTHEVTIADENGRRVATVRITNMLVEPAEE